MSLELCEYEVMKLEKTVKKKQSKLHDNNFPANISAVTNHHLFSMSSLSKKKKEEKEKNS